jgi:hypothetical protein
MRLPEISFRQLISIKDILIARAYYSTAFRTVSNEIVLDAPTNLSNSVSQDQDYKVHFGLFDLDQINSVIHHFDKLIIWTSITSACYLYIVYELENFKKMEKINELIDYSSIRKQTSIIVFIIMFIFFKNVPNAI